MSSARKVKTDVGEMPKPGNNGRLDFYDEFPLGGCEVGEVVTLKIKAKITSIHQDKYSSGIGFDIKSVEEYK